MSMNMGLGILEKERPAVIMGGSLGVWRIRRNRLL